jgi:hypothetical protein
MQIMQNTELKLKANIKTIAEKSGLKYNTVFKILQKNKVEPAHFMKGKNNKKVGLYYIDTLPAKILEAIEANKENLARAGGNDEKYETAEDLTDKTDNLFEVTSNDAAYEEGKSRLRTIASDENNEDNIFDAGDPGAGLDPNGQDIAISAADEYLPNPCVKYITADLIAWLVQLYGEETAKVILENDYGLGI